MKETSKHSSIKTVKPKKPVAVRDKEGKVSPWYDEYKDCFTFTFKPVNQTFIDRISMDLVAWARDNDKAVKIAQFYTSKGIHYDTYYSWIAKHPHFKMAHEMALELLGCRRELKALEKDYDSSYVANTMPMYDRKYKEMLEWKAKLKAESNENSGTKIVVMEKYQSSDLVPERKKK